jgi:hypothetical protein
MEVVCGVWLATNFEAGGGIGGGEKWRTRRHDRDLKRRALPLAGKSTPCSQSPPLSRAVAGILSPSRKDPAPRSVDMAHGAFLAGHEVCECVKAHPSIVHCSRLESSKREKKREKGEISNNLECRRNSKGNLSFYLTFTTARLVPDTYDSTPPFFLSAFLFLTWRSTTPPQPSMPRKCPAPLPGSSRMRLDKYVRSSLDNLKSAANPRKMVLCRLRPRTYNVHTYIQS